MRPDREALLSALRSVEDPEMPVSIVPLGIVRSLEVDEDGRVRVEAMPTFAGCPALAVIEERIREGLARVEGVRSVDVVWAYRPDWDVDAIALEGVRRLAGFGIAVPAGEEGVACPFCGSRDVVRESAFGPTLCRSLYYCRSCRNPFEAMKRLGRRGGGGDGRDGSGDG